MLKNYCLQFESENIQHEKEKDNLNNTLALINNQSNKVSSGSNLNGLENEQLFKINIDSSLRRQILIDKNIRLVSSIAKKYMNDFYKFGDLAQEGTIGLIKAIDTYDVTKEVKFATYSSRCIINQILMFIRTEKKHNNSISVNKVICSDYDGNEIKIDDTLDDGINYEDKVFDKMMFESIKHGIKVHLDNRERTIIISKYFEEKTQREIADELKLSQSYVSRIEKKALEKIKRYIESGIIKPSTLDSKAKRV